MINKVVMDNVATFKNREEFSPSLINYFYGFNGSGKTTLSNVLLNSQNYNKCSVEKDIDDTSEMVVYNKSFVEDLFSDSSRLKGIFTLGKDSGEALEIIDKSKKEIDILKKENIGLKTNIDKKAQEKTTFENDMKEKCWNQKLKVADTFSQALSGFVSSKDKFKNKCFEITLNTNNLKSIQDLENDYKLLFDKELIEQQELNTLNTNELSKIETNEIFNEVIKGNENTTVAELIDKLNNSDWVKQGLTYLEKSDNKCPFCQNKLTDDIKHLSEYFNKEYKEKCSKIESVKEQYENLSTNMINNLSSIIEEYFKDDKEMELLDEQIKTVFLNNKKNIEVKIATPSNKVLLEISDEIIQKINIKIVNLNQKIKDDNKKISNIVKEKEKFKSDLWNYIVNELDKDISVYKVNISSVEKALIPMNTKYSENEKKINELNEIIRENEKKITGITESLNEINKVLSSFGYDGFKLKEGNIQGTYKIIRPDGTDVGATLSEGEYRFISFLYYYYLISGSNETSGITRDKILVIDDPISSLDSNSLFIVSTLVKKLINECFNNENGIKQIFILTHNVYFYKEVVYRGSRDNKKETKEKYFVISKKNEISSIKEYDKNPVETTYQLLWEELKDDKINKNTCFNTMRRILEYYFNIIGKKDYEKAIDDFDGIDKIICKSLISCINDSSHYINEELSVVFDEDMVDRYKSVFKRIFENLGHIEHYNMMMNEEEMNNG